MIWKFAVILGIFLLVVLVSGCIGEDTGTPGGTTPQPQCGLPKKMINGICCNDDNNNYVCDNDQPGCPASCDDSNTCTNDTCSSATNFKCVHSSISPCCGNGVCDPSEDLNNLCPQDCQVISMTDFQYAGTPDYIDGNTFVFIHTTASESVYRTFFLNMTAPPDNTMENIRYTFKCNSTQYPALDSIDAVPDNLTEEDYLLKINRLNTTNYVVFTFFFMERNPAYRLDILQMDANEKASFHFKIMKAQPQKRDDLSCLIKFYFMKPRKIVYKWLKISYI